MIPGARPIVKARRYVDRPEDVPEGYEPQRGERGGWYYETEARSAEDDSATSEEGTPWEGVDKPPSELTTDDYDYGGWEFDISAGKYEWEAGSKGIRAAEGDDRYEINVYDMGDIDDGGVETLFDEIRSEERALVAAGAIAAGTDPENLHPDNADRLIEIAEDAAVALDKDEVSPYDYGPSIEEQRAAREEQFREGNLPEPVNESWLSGVNGEWEYVGDDSSVIGEGDFLLAEYKDEWRVVRLKGGTSEITYYDKDRGEVRGGYLPDEDDIIARFDYPEEPLELVPEFEVDEAVPEGFSEFPDDYQDAGRQTWPGQPVVIRDTDMDEVFAGRIEGQDNGTPRVRFPAGQITGVGYSSFELVSGLDYDPDEHKDLLIEGWQTDVELRDWNDDVGTRLARSQIAEWGEDVDGGVVETVLSSFSKLKDDVDRASAGGGGANSWRMSLEEGVPYATTVHEIAHGLATSFAYDCNRGAENANGKTAYEVSHDHGGNGSPVEHGFEDDEYTNFMFRDGFGSKFKDAVGFEAFKGDVQAEFGDASRMSDYDFEGVETHQQTEALESLGAGDAVRLQVPGEGTQELRIADPPDDLDSGTVTFERENGDEWPFPVSDGELRSSKGSRIVGYAEEPIEDAADGFSPGSEPENDSAFAEWDGFTEDSETPEEKVENLITAANKSWYKQAYVADKYGQSEAWDYTIGSHTYSSTNPHETLAMSHEVMFGGEADESLRENLTEEHPWLVLAWLDIMEPSEELRAEFEELLAELGVL